MAETANQAAPKPTQGRTEYTLRVDWPVTSGLCWQGNSDELQKVLTRTCERLDDNWLLGAPLMIEIREVETNAIRY